MDLKDLSKPLPIECIEFRVQSVNKGGYAVLLAYKDARVDMAVLDKVCGPCNWKREHSRDNKNCTVYIYCEKKKEWVGKEDTGTESYSDKNKGLASDSFKRACFNWGIGRELYDYPVMSVKLKSNEWKIIKDPKTGKEKAVTTWDFNLKQWAWVVKFDDKKQVAMLKGLDQNGAVRFSFDGGKVDAPKPPSKPPYPVEQYEKGAKGLYEGKCTIKDIEGKYTVSEACKKVLLVMVENLNNQPHPTEEDALNNAIYDASKGNNGQ